MTDNSWRHCGRTRIFFKTSLCENDLRFEYKIEVRLEIPLMTIFSAVKQYPPLCFWWIGGLLDPLQYTITVRHVRTHCVFISKGHVDRALEGAPRARTARDAVDPT